MVSNPFDNEGIECYTTKTFGESIKERREQLDISLWEMAKKIGISPANLGNIENGIEHAPSGNCLYFLEKELCLTDEQKKVFKLMAEITHINKIHLVDNYIIDNPYLLKCILKAIGNNMTNADWKNLYNSNF